MISAEGKSETAEWILFGNGEMIYVPKRKYRLTDPRRAGCNSGVKVYPEKWKPLSRAFRDDIKIVSCAIPSIVFLLREVNRVRCNYSDTFRLESCLKSDTEKNPLYIKGIRRVCVSKESLLVHFISVKIWVDFCRVPFVPFPHTCLRLRNLSAKFNSLSLKFWVNLWQRKHATFSKEERTQRSSEVS